MVDKLFNLTTLYSIIQQSAMQDSNDMVHTLSCRTAATSRFSPGGWAARNRWHQGLPTIRSGGPYLAGIHQMAPPKHTSGKQAYYSFIDPGKMKG